MDLLKLLALVKLSHGQTYEMTPQPGTFQQNIDYCANNGMQLATFSSFADVEKIHDVCTQSFCWIGFSDDNEDGEHIFVDGEVMDPDEYNIWLNDNEPHGGDEQSDWHCGCILPGNVVEMSVADCGSCTTWAGWYGVCERTEETVPFSCRPRRGTRVFENMSSVSCEAGETLVSCGIDGWNNVWGTYIDPSDPNTCIVGQSSPLQGTGGAGDGVQPVAVCCTFPADAIESVSTVTSTTAEANGLQVVTQCPDDTEVTGCQVNYQSGTTNNIRGSYAGPLQGTDTEPAQVAFSSGIDTLNQCVAEARTSGTAIRGGAQCIKPACGYKLDCVTSGELTNGSPGGDESYDGGCPADYTLVECSTYTPSNTLDDWHLQDTGGCYVQQDNYDDQYSLSVCCKLSRVDDEDCCTQDYNVQILIDESGSVSEDNYKATVDFVKKLITDDINPTAPVSVYSFGGAPDVELIYRFDEDQTSRNDVLAKLETAKHDYEGNATPTRYALETGIAEFERAINAGDLNDGPKLLFLLTDGQPCCTSDRYPCADNGNTIVDDLDRLGIKVIILGIDDFDTDPLTCLTDDITVAAQGFTSEAFDLLEATFKDELCDSGDDDVVAGPEPKTCKDAQKYCKEVLGTNLATIRTTEDRQAAIAALNGISENEAWIGLFSDEINTKWQFRSGAECPSASAYKCVDFWLSNPGGFANRPHCIGDGEMGSGCAYFNAAQDGVDNDRPKDIAMPFLCDSP